MLSLLKNLVFIGLALVLIAPVNAATDDSGPAIQGYSPVSYFTKGFAEHGDADHAVTHKGKTYYLASAEQVEIFRQNPEKYVPQMDVCPYSMLHGRRLSIDPTNFKIIAGKLLLFHDSVELNALKKWNKNVKQHDIDETDLLERSQQNYEFYQSEAVSSQKGI